MVDHKEFRAALKGLSPEERDAFLYLNEQLEDTRNMKVEALRTNDNTMLDSLRAPIESAKAEVASVHGSIRDVQSRFNALIHAFSVLEKSVTATQIVLMGLLAQLADQGVDLHLLKEAQAQDTFNGLSINMKEAILRLGLDVSENHLDISQLTKQEKFFEKDDIFFTHAAYFTPQRKELMSQELDSADSAQLRDSAVKHVQTCPGC